jgi:hypothetical protein
LLKRIGLDDQLRKIGSPISNMTLRTSQGGAITTRWGRQRLRFRGTAVRATMFIVLIS